MSLRPQKLKAHFVQGWFLLSILSFRATLFLRAVCPLWHSR